MGLRGLPPDVKELLALPPEDRSPQKIERAWRSLAADASFLRVLVGWALRIFRGPSAEDAAAAFFLDSRKIPDGPAEAVTAALGKTGLGRVLRKFDLGRVPGVNPSGVGTDSASATPFVDSVIISSFAGFLHRSFVRFCLREWGRETRRALREVSSDDTWWALIPAPGNSPESTVRARELGESARRFHAALKKLRPLDREVIVMYYFAERSIPEMAKILGISEGAVAVRLYRARKRLARLLREMP